MRRLVGKEGRVIFVSTQQSAEGKGVSVEFDSAVSRDTESCSWCGYVAQLLPLSVR